MTRPPLPAAAGRPRRREQDIQREILNLLHARGVAAWPVNRESGVRRALDNARITARIGGPGFADIIGILSICIRCERTEIHWGHEKWGRFFAIEVKAPKGRTQRLRALAQAAFGAVVTKAGGLYLRIDPQATATACEQVSAAFGWRVEGTRTTKEMH